LDSNIFTLRRNVTLCAALRKFVRFLVTWDYLGLKYFLNQISLKSDVNYTVSIIKYLFSMNNYFVKVTKNLTNLPKKFCESPPWTLIYCLRATLMNKFVKKSHLLIWENLLILKVVKECTVHVLISRAFFIQNIGA